jgi:hypothetical protein
LLLLIFCERIGKIRANFREDLGVEPEPGRDADADADAKDPKGHNIFE